MKMIILYGLMGLSIGASASQSRGVWFWYASSSPYGSSNIVGNASLEAQTVGFLSAALQPYSLAGDLEFETTNSETYIMQFSQNLCNWKEIHRVRSARPGVTTTNLPVDISTQKGFFKIYRFEDFPEQ